MKLIYHIPDKLYYIQNFLDQKTYKGIHDSIFKERNKINLHSSKGIWDNGLINNIVPPDRVTVSNHPPFEKLKVLTRFNQFYQLKDVKEMTTNIHFMKKGSGINWHDDSTWKYGATFYVNRRWGTQNGGELMFHSENGHGFIPIVGNSLVIIKAPINHKVNPVLSPVIPRISIQMFIK
jgi:Rps23 Pro-64 3,4-dihydroxylase Tpa1-like proline 4-hydroxylase